MAVERGEARPRRPRAARSPKFRRSTASASRTRPPDRVARLITAVDPPGAPTTQHSLADARRQHTSQPWTPSSSSAAPAAGLDLPLRAPPSACRTSRRTATAPTRVLPPTVEPVSYALDLVVRLDDTPSTARWRSRWPCAPRRDDSRAARQGPRVQGHRVLRAVGRGRVRHRVDVDGGGQGDDDGDVHLRLVATRGPRHLRSTTSASSTPRWRASTARSTSTSRARRIGGVHSVRVDRRASLPAVLGRAAAEGDVHVLAPRADAHDGAVEHAGVDGAPPRNSARNSAQFF